MKFSGESGCKDLELSLGGIEVVGFVMESTHICHNFQESEGEMEENDGIKTAFSVVYHALSEFSRGRVPVRNH